METALGVLLVMLAGLTMGSSAWPIKLVRKFQFEHWWFLAMVTGLIVLPWGITLIVFPNALQALADVPLSVLITSNLFSLSWGLANVLCALCFVRIGIGLTGAILTGLGASVAVIVPLIFKGSGLFQNAPSITSPAGIGVMCGVGVMLSAVLLTALAGFGRDRVLQKQQSTSGSFLVGLIMAVVAGVTSAGIMLAFVYGHEPIVSRLCTIEAGKNVKLTVEGNKELSHDYLIAEDGALAIEGVGNVALAGLNEICAAGKVAELLNLPQESENSAKVSVKTSNIFAVFPVWAFGLFGGMLINVLYPAFLMTKRKNWGVLLTSGPEIALSILMGVQFCLAIVLVGKGMVLLGALGASVGAGIQQAMQMLGGQGVGFVSGEWKGVHGTPRLQMYCAIALLIVATAIMTYSNMLAN